MRYETLPNLQIPKIGFGTWRIGNDPSADERSRLALRSALKIGYTHFDTAEAYAAGHAEELLGQVVHEMNVPRPMLFITSKVSPEHLQPADVLRCCENSLRRLGMDYLDLYLIHWPGVGMKLEEPFQALNKLVQDGKVRHLGVSNFNLKLLQKAAGLSAAVTSVHPDLAIVKHPVRKVRSQSPQVSGSLRKVWGWVQPCARGKKSPSMGNFHGQKKITPLLIEILRCASAVKTLPLP